MENVEKYLHSLLTNKDNEDIDSVVNKIIDCVNEHNVELNIMVPTENKSFTLNRESVTNNSYEYIKNIISDYMNVLKNSEFKLVTLDDIKELLTKKFDHLTEKEKLILKTLDNKYKEEATNDYKYDVYAEILVPILDSICDSALYLLNDDVKLQLYQLIVPVEMICTLYFEKHINRIKGDVLFINDEIFSKVEKGADRIRKSKAFNNMFEENPYLLILSLFHLLTMTIGSRDFPVTKDTIDQVLFEYCEEDEEDDVSEQNLDAQERKNKLKDL